MTPAEHVARLIDECTADTAEITAYLTRQQTMKDPIPDRTDRR